MLLAAACQKGEISNLNTPDENVITVNPTRDELRNLATGVEAGMRFDLAAYFDGISVIGREMYRFASSEPRYTSELLGAGGTAQLDNNGFYLTNPWASRYRNIKQCNILIKGATNSSFVTDAQKKGLIGFAKTIRAYQLLLNLNLTQSNGIRINVADPENLGPFVKQGAMDSIANMLDEAKADLTGSEIIFDLSDGFAGFKTPEGLIRFNRALAARVAVYRQKWADALTNLNQSFFDLNGNYRMGIYHVFSTNPGDEINRVFMPQNQNGEVRVAHPSYIIQMTAGDARGLKTSLRTSAASQNGLTSNRDVWVYRTNTDPIPIIRNEELILIYAEAKIQTSAIPDALVAINRIRTSNNLPVYTGSITQAALITEMLNQRRYSLYMEGHRWIDMRRYNLLETLPKDRPGDDVWVRYPIPQNEREN